MPVPYAIYHLPVLVLLDELDQEEEHRIDKTIEPSTDSEYPHAYREEVITYHSATQDQVTQIGAGNCPAYPQQKRENKEE